jgi:hypothetical protein
MQLSRRSQIVLAGLALVAMAIPARAADINKFLPDDAEIVMVLNVQQILQSPLVQKHGAAHIKQLMLSDETVKKTLEALGFDPLKDLTRITLAASAVSPDAKGSIIAEGTFDVAKFEAKAAELAKDKKEQFIIIMEGSHKLLQIKNPGEEKPSYGTMVDKNTIVFSMDKAFVMESFDRASGKKTPALKKEIAALIGKANQSQSMWLVAPGAVFVKSPLAEDEKNKKILEKIENVSVGFTVAEDFTMLTSIVTKTEDSAKEISQQLKDGLEQMKGLLALVAGQQKELAPLVDIVGSIKVGTESATVTLKSEVSHEMIEKSLKKDS